MKISLHALDSKYPNLALMKLSTWHKAQGDEVVLNPISPSGIDKSYISIILTQSRPLARKVAAIFPNATIGGSGWGLATTLPPSVEACSPDYTLYQAADLYPFMKGAKSREQKMLVAQGLISAGIGFSARGCNNFCSYCIVPRSEGKIRQESSIESLLNTVTGSRELFLLDNAFVSDPLFFEKIEEIKRLDLTVDIQSGVDLRLMTPKIAKALASIKHKSGLRGAWDVPCQENSVLRGIKTLKEYFKGDLTCYTLVGYNSTEEEDIMRVRKLHEYRVRPYVMLMRHLDRETEEKTFERTKLEHLKRWVNGFLYKTIPFSAYEPWVKFQQKMQQQPALSF